MSLPLRQHAAIDLRMISATSRYAGIDPVLIGLASAFDLEAVSALFNEQWENVLFAPLGGSNEFRKPRFAVWIGYDF